SRRQIDRRSRLRIRGARVIDRNVAFAGLIVSRLWSRRWCGAAATAAATAAAISSDVANRSSNTWTGYGGRIRYRPTLSFRRSRAHEVAPRLQPEQAIFTKIVGAPCLYDIQDPLALLIRIFERFDVHVGHRFAVTVEDSSRDCSCRHYL